MALWNPDIEIAPSPEPKKSGGFLNWLSGNYSEVTDSIRDIACIIKPETCAGGGPASQPTVIVQDDPSAKNYFLMLGALIVLVLVVIAKK